MGRPLRKLHQIHSVSPYGVDVCNIRTKNPKKVTKGLDGKGLGGTALCVKKRPDRKGGLHNDLPLISASN
jgi:hypothetical protein